MKKLYTASATPAFSPFVVLALLLWLVPSGLQPFLAVALASYGALIVLFLGGIHWRLGFNKGNNAACFHFVWGVTPSLLAWLALMMAAQKGLTLLGLVVASCYAVDRKTYPAANLASWLTLRLHLTAVATLSCVVGAAAL